MLRVWATAFVPILISSSSDSDRISVSPSSVRR